jgi:uncharacterized DUF497 family protein
MTTPVKQTIAATPVQNWSVFTQSDAAFAAVGFLGFVSVSLVLYTALRNMAIRELSLRKSKRGVKPVTTLHS